MCPIRRNLVKITNTKLEKVHHEGPENCYKPVEVYNYFQSNTISVLDVLGFITGCKKIFFPPCKDFGEEDLREKLVSVVSHGFLHRCLPHYFSRTEPYSSKTAGSDMMHMDHEKSIFS
jgi:hypothetical protein